MSEEKQRVYHNIVARYHSNDARWFAVVGFAPMIVGALGMVTSSISYFGWSFDIGQFLGLGSFILTESMIMIPIYFIASMLFFAGGIEWWVLCRHCPCYEHSGCEHGNQGRFYCLANWGSPKIFKYSPTKISWPAKATFLLWTGFYLLFPIVYLLDRWDFALTLVIVAAFFVATLRHWGCAQCPNFECVLNCVGESDKEKFLKELAEGTIY